MSSFYQQRFCFGTVGGSWAVKCQSMWTWAGVDGWVGPEEEEEEEQGGRREEGAGRALFCKHSGEEESR